MRGLAAPLGPAATLAALAALAVAGVASDQSSVTLFGIVDASISGVSNKSDLQINPLLALTNPLAYAYVPGSITASKTGVNNSADSSSRLGFRGVEDLGGGLAASFWLEGELSNDDGTANGLNFKRRSTVSLSGPFGEVRLGRDYKPSFWNLTVFDPFGTNGAGSALVQRAAAKFEADNVRSSNSIGYFLPQGLGGFYGQAQYAFHEQVKYNGGLQGAGNDNSRGGRYWGGRFGYAGGPVDVALSYGEQDTQSSYNLGADALVRSLNIAGSYDFGVAKLFAQYQNTKQRVSYSANSPAFNPATKLNGYLLGVTVPMGAGQIKATYGNVKIKTDQPLTALNNPFFTYNAPAANQLALGYVYNLSKRTALYTTVAYIKNKNGANFSAGSGNIDTNFAGSYTSTNGSGTYLPKSSVGYDFGIRHSF